MVSSNLAVPSKTPCALRRCGESRDDAVCGRCMREAEWYLSGYTGRRGPSRERTAVLCGAMW